jgi:phytol kinase
LNRESVLREIRRKSIHVIPGFLAIPFIIVLGKIVALLTSLGFFILYLLNEISLRRNLGWRVPIAYHTYIVMARREELVDRTFIGTVYFWGLTTIAIALLPPQPAAATVMISSLGDAAAAIMGKAYPYPRNPLNRRKSISGSISMFIVSIISCLLVGYSILGAIILSMIASLTEALTKKSVNDELSVPAITGIFSYPIYVFLNG